MSEQGLETIETTVQKTREWMSREEFLAAVQARIIADRVIDPAETVQNVLAVVADHMGGGEMQKAIDAFPRDRRSLFPAPASAA